MKHLVRKMFGEGAFHEKVGVDIMPRIEVVLDACVLFPASLRDILLRAAEVGLYRIRLSDTILEETRRNLVKLDTPIASCNSHAQHTGQNM